MKLTLTEFVTLDGISQGPGSPDEDTSDGFTQGGWLVPHLTDPADLFAEKMNSIQKYVASRSLVEASWAPTTILSGEVPAQVAELKRHPGRELQIHGRARLSQSLLAAGLVRSKTTPGGLAVLVYESTGLPEYGTYQAGA